MRRRRVSIRAILIVVLVIACAVAAAVPMFSAKGKADYGSASAPDRESVQDMQMTFSAAAVESRDKVEAAAAQQKDKSRKKKKKDKDAEQASGFSEQEIAEKAKQARAKTQEEQTAEPSQATGETGTPVMGSGTVTAKQMAALYNMRASYPAKAMEKGGAPTIEDFCQIIVDEAAAEGVRADVVFAQAMIETGWLKFGGSDSISQYNFSGLGTVGDGNPGNSFADVRTGIRAQVQHLKAYACTDELTGELVDQRFDKVIRGSAPYIEWLGMQENPYGLGWAGGKEYGKKILKIISDMQSL